MFSLPEVLFRKFSTLRKSLKPTDDFEIEYHLTPNGWRRGSEWFFGRIQADNSVPTDRVLTLKKRAYQRTGDVEREISWSTVWRNPDVSEAELVRLQTTFRMPEGPAPENVR